MTMQKGRFITMGGHAVYIPSPGEPTDHQNMARKGWKYSGVKGDGAGKNIHSYEHPSGLKCDVHSNQGTIVGVDPKSANGTSLGSSGQLHGQSSPQTPGFSSGTHVGQTGSGRLGIDPANPNRSATGNRSATSADAYRAISSDGTRGGKSMSDEERNDQISKAFAKRFARGADTKPNFTFTKNGLDMTPSTGVPKPIKITESSPKKVDEEESKKALSAAEDIISQRLERFTRTNAWEISRDQETREFAGKIVGNANQRFKLEKVAGSEEGQAVAMDGSKVDRSGKDGDKPTGAVGGRVWSNGIDTVGDPERNSPNRTFDIVDDSQGHASGVLDTKEPPKSPINKPLPGTARRGGSSTAQRASKQATGNAVPVDESTADQFGFQDENTDLSVAMEAMDGIFDDPMLLQALQRIWNTNKAPLRGITTKEAPPIASPPDLTSPSVTVGGKKPTLATPPKLVPPPEALEQPGNIPIRREDDEEPLSVNQLRSHKAKK
jgi:hypothetical protein